ncbi:MAG: type pilus assembly protein PilB [Solirubrobacteraceae bacterium]|nr:type pilus assembly protein PilB [Solirubrobacteraceae bacterium]
MSSDQPAREPASRPRPGRLLGDVLVSLGFCDRATVEDIVRQARAAGRPMGQLLLDQGFIDAAQLAVAIAERFGLQAADLETLVPDAAAMALVSPAALRRLEAVPIGFRDPETLLVAMSNPSNVVAVDDLAMLTDLRVEPVVVAPADLDVLLARLDHVAVAPVAHAEPAPAPADGAACDLVRAIVSRAVALGATAVHVDPDGGHLLVRHRIDGLMAEAERVSAPQAAGVIAEIKILCDLDVAERRLPQDGRVSLELDGRRIDVRVRTVPLVDGESAVLRLLEPARRPLALAELGMGDGDRVCIERAFARSRGAVLAAGPSGSGTSTTLRAALGLADPASRTVMTIEDPVELRLPGVQQMQVRARTGLDFATGLRAIAGADPDVILAGELVDHACAHIAVAAAIGGRLVLGALPAADAPAAAVRLVDMGIEPYLVAAALDCVVAQRLVRRLCEHCRRPARVAAADVGLATEGEIDIFEAAGCAHCRVTGYRGRTGIFEVMAVTEEIRALVVARAPASEIRRVAIAEGMRTLVEDGLAKVRAGETTLTEVVRVTS